MGAGNKIGKKNRGRAALHGRVEHHDFCLSPSDSPTTSPATSSRPAGWPSHCDDTSATAHVWSPRPTRPSSESPCDAKSSAAKGECVPQSLPRKDNAPEPCSAPLFSARLLSIPAKSSAASDRQSREAPGRGMHLLSLCLTNNLEIDDCQCRKLPWAGNFPFNFGVQ